MIDVILPVKDRPEVERCVRSLLLLPSIDRIWICDGGSQDQCREVLESLQRSPQVQVLKFPDTGFNKSYLINQGIRHCLGDRILISDADIIWNESALGNLQDLVDFDANTIGTVLQVLESYPETSSLKRDRYSYHIAQNTDVLTLKIYLADQQTHRPGCGLLLAQRSILLQLGGYKECFQGWGWEDQDLLIRAQLLGFKVEAAGQVLHLSHPDQQRNRFHQNAAPVTTRDRNLVVAIAALLKRNFWGDLPPLPSKLMEAKNIQIYLPQKLRNLLHEFCCQGIVDHDIPWESHTFESTDELVATASE